MMEKTYSREYEASPSFTWLNSSLAIGSTQILDWETYNSSSVKYLPFNFIRIINNGEDDIWIYPQQDSSRKFLVPKGTFSSISRATIPALTSCSIVHAGSTSNISASKIIITCSKEGETTDSIVSRLHKRLYGENKRGLV